MKQRLTIWAIVLLAAFPAFAGAQHGELIASSAFTASGVSATANLNTAGDLVLTINVTAITGTSPVLDAWLQVAEDSTGAVWYDYPADATLVSVNAAGAGTGAANARDPVNGISTGATGQYLAIYKNVAADRVRLKWIISGTTPSFTFSAKYVAK